MLFFTLILFKIEVVMKHLIKNYVQKLIKTELDAIQS
ncbi:TPA: RfbT protein, partial [Vibrio cholerae]